MSPTQTPPLSATLLISTLSTIILAFDLLSTDFSRKPSAPIGNSTSNTFTEVAEKLKGKDGTLPRLLNDNSVYDNLDSLVLNVQALVNEFNDNPSKYIKAYLKAKK